MAANQNNPQAQTQLGTMYFLGKKVSYGFDEAINYLLMAAKQNHAEALYFLTVLYYNGKHLPKYFLFEIISKKW